MQITSYNEAREYLESFIRASVTERIEADSVLPHPLKRMQELLALLGNPQEKFRSIQVSGTAGKGSTSYLISHILTTAGYKTGLTLSPHLQRINERLQINNQEIDDKSFITLLNTVIPSIEKLSVTTYSLPSYFEILIAMAFTYFAQEKVDIAVVEVGLEGKLDGTNTLTPLIAVLTNIDLDHTEILGDSVEKIAEEAVSIIKQNEPESESSVVISGVKQKTVKRIVQECARKAEALLLLLSEDFNFTVRNIDKSGSLFDFNSNSISYPQIKLSLLGEFQIENATLSIETILQLKRFGFDISEGKIREAMRTASFPGRFEVLTYNHQTLLLDGAHNPIKMKAFLSALESFYPEKRKVFIVTFKKGKEVAGMLTAIKQTADVLILTEFHRTIDTGKNASIMSDELRLIEEKLESIAGVQIHIAASTEEALSLALRIAEEKDMIIVTGSLYLVGEVKDVVVKTK